MMKTQKLISLIGAGYMYVNTYTDKALDEWSHLIPTFQNGYWLFESGKYPISEGDYYSSRPSGHH